MPTLTQLRVRVDDTERAGRFFAAVFGWPLRRDWPEAAVLPCHLGGNEPSAQLVFTDDRAEPPVRLGFAVGRVEDAAREVERLGGQIEQAGPAAARGRDSQGVPLLLYPGDGSGDGSGPGPEVRGVLGVIFVFAGQLERAAEFYRAFARWQFRAIGRDKDILFVTDGPPVGIRRGPGAVTFHVSVPDPGPAIDAIQAAGGQAGPPAGAGTFATRDCRDDQGTAFALWYPGA